MDESKSVLIKQLENLLGFDDGADDILEHLLPIKSSEDLRDYLSQLSGLDGDNDNVQTFVNDVGKFQRGEKLSVIDSNKKEESDEKKEEGEKFTNTFRTNVTKTKKRNNKQKKQQQQESKGSNGAGKKLNTTAKNKPNITKKSTQTKSAAAAAAAVKPVTTNKTTTQLKDTPPSEQKPTFTTIPTKKEEAPKKSKPMKGEASHVCGCYGTKHKPLTNCLCCGRISCIKEGYDYCPFCGFLVEQIGQPPDDEADKKAWQHKERLLQFDRDSARRTVVWDDQEDYFASAKSTWLSKEEQATAREKETERNKILHERQKQTLDIVF